MLAYPDIPTIAECGLVGYDIGAIMRILAPRGIPEDIVVHLSREIMNIMQMAEVQARLQGDGAVAIGSTREQFAARIKTEVAKWAQLVKDAGVEMRESPS